MTGRLTRSPVIRGVAEVEDFARGCFRAGPGERAGVELEFLVFDRERPGRMVPVAEVAAVLPGLPGGSRVTFEPGGQLELSGPPGPLPDAIGWIASDVDVVATALGEVGLALGGFGLDPVRPPRRQTTEPRYEAMSEYLGVPYGALMMCSTASVQVNLDLGEHPQARWERADRLGPVLTAAFANSPLREGRPTGWMSGRQHVWAHLDPTRTAPVHPAEDPVKAWTQYLLDARLMLLHDDEGRCRPVRDGSTFRDRLTGPGLTAADLAYHATTCFPPVRPRGWLEIRYLDAQHPARWPVAVAVTHALITDDRAAGAALAAAEPCRDLWRRAARHGLADPEIHRAATACFDAALGALPRLGAPPALTRQVAEFADRHVTPGLSPAAALLGAAGTGRLMEGHL